MKTIQAEDRQAAVEVAANLFIDAANAYPEKPVGLATGGTMDGIYNQLSKLGFLPKTQHAFVLDEYVGLPSGHQNSYQSELEAKFCQQLGWDGVLHVPGVGDYEGTDGLSNFENAIDHLGPVSVQLLGLGSNGHVAFNEPGAEAHSVTRIVELHEQTRRDNSRFFTAEIQVPTHAYTQGLATIAKAKSLLLVVLGESKRQVLLRDMSPAAGSPLSALLGHSDITLLTDFSL